jgi:LysM repeat protein
VPAGVDELHPLLFAQQEYRVRERLHYRFCHGMTLPAVLLVAVFLWLAAAQVTLAGTPVYTVAPGDTLAAIAKSHGTNVAVLLRLNQLSDPNLIRAGQKLTLPEGSKVSAAATVPVTVSATETVTPTTPTRVYVVQPGDNLASVAVKFTTTPARLAELNQRSPSSDLHIGEPLRVPEAHGVTFTSFQGDDIPVPGNYYIHVLQAGESLAAVAKAYNTSLRRMVKLNKIEDAANVKPGLRIVVPPPSYAELFADVPVGPDGYPVYPVIPTTGKWISVDLDHQRVWAWEGDKMINSFLISSGKARTPTVTGVFRIWAKIASQTMEGGSRAAGDYYNLPGVQWVQYFYQDYSFHAAYWHHNFGTPMSHGCVNMTNADARWLYEWASPTVDDYKWHVTDKTDPGTLVVVYQ